MVEKTQVIYVKIKRQNFMLVVCVYSQVHVAKDCKKKNLTSYNTIKYLSILILS